MPNVKDERLAPQAAPMRPAPTPPQAAPPAPTAEPKPREAKVDPKDLAPPRRTKDRHGRPIPPGEQVPVDESLA